MDPCRALLQQPTALSSKSNYSNAGNVTLPGSPLVRRLCSFAFTASKPAELRSCGAAESLGKQGSLRLLIKAADRWREKISLEEKNTLPKNIWTKCQVVIETTLPIS